MTKPSRLLALPLGITLLSANPAFAADPAPAETRALQARADVWWDDISVMASDKMEGRLTGSAGYNRAADFVISRFHAEGLLPGGDAGSYKQNVAFDTQVINELASTAALTGADGRAHPVAVGPAMLISSYGAPRPASVDAPLVFNAAAKRARPQEATMPAVCVRLVTRYELLGECDVLAVRAAAEPPASDA